MASKLQTLPAAVAEHVRDGDGDVVFVAASAIAFPSRRVTS